MANNERVMESNTATLAPAADPRPAPFRRVYRLGTVPTGGRNSSVYVRAEYDDRGRLSIVGVVGPNAHGGCNGGCGQIFESLEPKEFATLAPGWTADKIRELKKVWGAWHLNDMKAGTPEQTAAVDAWLAEGHRYEYGAICEHLKSVGLYEVPDPRPGHTFGGVAYRYGTAWLSEEVPAEVLMFLLSLPEADRACSWGDL